MHMHKWIKNIQNNACKLVNIDSPDKNPINSVMVKTSVIIKPISNLQAYKNIT